MQNLPSTGFVRLPQVLAVIPVSKSTWWAGCSSGKYPAAIHHGRSAFWKAEDIHALIQQIGAQAQEQKAA